MHVENMTSRTKDYGWVTLIYSVNKTCFCSTTHTYCTGVKLVEDQILYTKGGNYTHCNSLISIYIYIYTHTHIYIYIVDSGLCFNREKVFINRTASD